MSKEPYKLTEDQIKNLAFKIAKPIYKYINKTIVRELSKFPNIKQVDINDYINIVIVALCTIDKNMLEHLRRFYLDRTKHEIDFIKLVTNYIYNINTIITEDHVNKYKDKMN